MGNYISQADIEAQVSSQTVIELTDDNSLGSVDVVNLTKVIDDSEGIANGYLEGKYTVPLSPVPSVLKAVVVDIAVYRLHLRRSSVPEDVDRAYRMAIDFLKDVSKGVASLGSEATTPETTSHSVDIQSDDRIFKESDFGGF